MDVSEHKTKNLKQTQNKKSETDKYRLVEYHSFITFLYTTVITMALIISITRMSKWTVPSVMSYVITLENKH